MPNPWFNLITHTTRTVFTFLAHAGINIILKKLHAKRRISKALGFIFRTNYYYFKDFFNRINPWLNRIITSILTVSAIYLTIKTLPRYKVQFSTDKKT
jgi:hypothetical protein